MTVRSYAEPVAVVSTACIETALSIFFFVVERPPRAHHVRKEKEKENM